MTPDTGPWAPCLDAWMQAQRLQADWLQAWQRSWAALLQELYDDWACRWAGGVPIDA